jgi:hypothetical protein
MNKQPEALRLASELLALGYGGTCSLAAAELRRLYQLAQEQHTEIYGLRLQVRNLLEALDAYLLTSDPGPLRARGHGARGHDSSQEGAA